MNLKNLGQLKLVLAHVPPSLSLQARQNGELLSLALRIISELGRLGHQSIPVCSVGFPNHAQLLLLHLLDLLHVLDLGAAKTQISVRAQTHIHTTQKRTAQHSTAAQGKHPFA